MKKDDADFQDAASEEDVIEKTIGKFGRYQFGITVLIMFGRVLYDYQIYSVVFILPKANYICLDDNAYNMSNHCPCENPKFEVKDIVSSVTTDWNLICEKTVIASFAQSMIQFGYLPGSMLCGYFSDKFGRRIMLSVIFFLVSVLAVLTAAVSQLWLFLVLRFMTGFLTGGSAVISFVFAMELVGRSFRTHMNALILGTNAFSYLSLSMFAYFIREWRYLQLASAAPWLVTIFYYWLIPESPRWQITVGRVEEAIESLTKIARKNGLPTDHIQETVLAEVNKSFKNEKEHHGSCLDLFKTPGIRFCTIASALMWGICGHVYYGINQYIGRLQGNLYLNTALSAVSLGVAISYVSIVTAYLRRKITLSLSFMTTTAAMIVFVFTSSSHPYINLTSSLIGNLAIFTAFIQLYLLTSEIFPTVIRNTAIGFASTCARVGSFLAPFSVNIGVEWQTFLIFIVLPLVGTVLCWFLPETKGIVLKNTVKESEALSDKNTTSKKIME